MWVPDKIGMQRNTTDKHVMIKQSGIGINILSRSEDNIDMKILNKNNAIIGDYYQQLTSEKWSFTNHYANLMFTFL